MMRIYAQNVGALTFSALLASAAFVACDGKGGPEARLAASELTGVEGCLRACDTFKVTGCRTRAANFCTNAQQNCSARYDTSPACLAQLKALDTCSAGQPAGNYVCPLGTLPAPIRPYHLSEDACLEEAQALADCLHQ